MLPSEQLKSYNEITQYNIESKTRSSAIAEIACVMIRLVTVVDLLTLI